ncbi:MAG: tetratricopeptide repeat protein [Myxococcaceae bacterium]
MRTLLVALLLLAVSCKDKTAEPVQAAAQSDEERSALALLPVKGDGKEDADVKQWQQRARELPMKPEAWLGLAEAWIRRARIGSDAGDYLSAEAAADLAAAKGGGSQAAGLQAMVLLNRHQFKEVVKKAEQTLAKDPDDLRTLGALADAQLELGELDAAAGTVQHMIDLKPNLPSYGRASYLRWLNGDRETAVKYARLAIDSGRDGHDVEPRAWTLCQAAGYFWQAGDYEGALTGYDAALGTLPGFAPALQGKGRALLSLGRAAEAAVVLEQSFNARPLVETGSLWVEALEAAHDARAAEAIEKTEEEGKRGDAYGLGLFYANRNVHTDEAVALLEKEKSSRPGVYVVDALAWAYYRAGKLDLAERESALAVAHGTPDARLLFHRGTILVASGKTAEGQALIARAEALNPRGAK